MSGPIDTFSGVRLAVVGDVMLDHYIHGDAIRISPEAPVPVVRCENERWTPGGAGHAARSATSLGASVELTSVVGDDAGAEQLHTALSEAGVSANLVVAHDRPTIRKMRVFAGHHHVARVDHERAGGLPPELEESVAAAAADLAARADGVLISDYGKGVVTERVVRSAVEAAGGRPVVVDPKGAAWERYRGAHTITPNTNELALVAGAVGAEREQLRGLAERLSRDMRPTALLVTQGAHGMSLFVDGEHIADDAARARQVSDVTGAGDTVAACIALAAAAGLDPRIAMHWANVAAGVVVERSGTAVVTAEELERALEQ